jgi:hypothetical protein
VTLVHGCGPGHALAQAAIQRAVQRIVADGGSRVRRGITVTARMADPNEGGSPQGGRPAAGGGTPGTGGGLP